MLNIIILLQSLWFMLCILTDVDRWMKRWTCRPINGQDGHTSDTTHQTPHHTRQDGYHLSKDKLNVYIRY